MIWLYRIFFIPVFLVSLPYYLKRMLKRGGYGKDFHHRLGLIEKLREKKPGILRIWIQAVSLGEINAIKPLIDKWIQKGNSEIVITTTTSTAYKIARDLYGDKVLKVAAFPFDFWLTSRRAWERVKPDIVILMEGELWPEHIHQAVKRNIPVLLINARLSDRSYKRHLKFKFLSKHWVLKHLRYLLAGSQRDLDRFIAIGMDPKKAFCTGNIKFDVMPNRLLSELEKTQMKESMGFIDSPLILMGSSTWPGEETLLLKIFEKALNLGIDCRLLIVPRHSERREELKDLLKTQERPWHFRSLSPSAPQDTYIYIGDTMGELSILSQVADLVFIGKSLPPNNGGQTPVEAASLGLPMLYGPNMTNFKEICDSLQKSHAAICCNNEQEVEDQIIALLTNYKKRETLAIAVKEWHEANKGATDKTFGYIEQLIDANNA